MAGLALNGSNERKSSRIASEARIADSLRRKAAAQGAEQVNKAYENARNSLFCTVAVKVAEVRKSRDQSAQQKAKLVEQFRRVERLHRQSQKQLLTGPLKPVNELEDIQVWQNALETVDRDIRVLEKFARIIKKNK